MIGLGLSDTINPASGGSGDDTFIITRFQYGTLEIDDVFTSLSGQNLIKFDYGVTITAYREVSFTLFDVVIDSVTLTLSTGAVVTIAVPAGSFGYQLGSGEVLTYADFKTAIGATGMDSLRADYAITSFTDAPELSDPRLEARVARSLSGAGNEDIITAASDYNLTVSGGSGDDVFVVTRFQYGMLEIDDVFTSSNGQNLIKFDYGVTITAYREVSFTLFDVVIDSVALTLSTGAVVTIVLPAGSFGYQLGSGDVLTYADFKAAIGATGASDLAGDFTISASSVRFDANFARTGNLEETHSGGTTSYSAGAEVVTATDTIAVSASSVTLGNPDITYDFAASGNPNNYFVIDPSSGAITWAAERTFDFETLTEADRTLEIVVIATEVAGSGTGQTGTGDTARVTITLTIQNEQEGDGTYVIRGNVATGATLEAVVTDPDGTQSVTYEWYSLASGGGDRQPLGATQSITLDQNADLTRTYHVTITHTDLLGDEHTETLQAPAVQFSEASYTANPYEGTDSLPDVDATLTGATLTYGFLTDRAAGTVEDESGPFMINTATGAISLISGMVLDHETTQSYSLIVRASDQDGSGASGDVGVTINVQDVNEHDPVIAGGATATASISEDAARNAMVTTVAVTDADTTDTGHTFAITSGNIGNVFFIDPTSGVITVFGTLDHETTDSYDLVVTVTDTGVDSTGNAAPRTATQTITVTIEDVNDSDPTATTGGTQTFAERTAVTSDTPTGFFITISDLDTGVNINDHNVVVIGTHASRFKFVEDGTTANQWNLVLIDGQEVDREAGYVINDLLTVEYQITDGTRYTSPSNSVGITITDINDNRPVVREPDWEGSPLESGVPDNVGTTQLFIVRADDADKNQSSTFRIVSVDGVGYTNGVPDDGSSALFAIQPISGRFGVIGNLDHEVAQSHTIVFEAIDPGGMVSDPKEVVVTVINVDEGDATYAITGTTENNGSLSVAVTTADPDGLVANSETYRWFILNTDGSVPAASDANGDIADAGSDDGNDATLKLPADVGNNVYGVVVTYMDNAGETERVTVTVRAASPAQISDRPEPITHDPYDPDDLGLTPLPDADPNAG